MEQQLYRFVKVSERLPEKHDDYFTRVRADDGEIYNSITLLYKGEFEMANVNAVVVEWLEPIPTGKVSAEQVLGKYISEIHLSKNGLPEELIILTKDAIKAMEEYASQFKPQPIEEDAKL